MADDFSLPGAPQQTPNLPSNYRPINFHGFSTLNTKPTRPAIQETEMFWCDNFMPLGDDNLRTLYSNGVPLYTATGGNTVTFFNFGNIGTVPYCIVFLSDGSIVAVNTTTKVAQTIAPAGTITSPGSVTVGVSQWGSIYILICAPQPNGFFMWDGTLFYQAGTLGPTVTMINSGLDYTSSPTITTSGGSGSGATFSSQISNGVIQQITVTNPGIGYVVGDIIALIFTGGGSTTSAKATATIAAGAVTGLSGLSGGTGYTATTKVIFLGGGGTGATATVTVAAGAVTGITVTNGGEGYTTPPTMLFDDANNPVAVATAQVMPFGVQGTAIEVFTQRVWIANGDAPSAPPALGLVQFSAPGSPQDFDSGNGAGAFVATNSFLRIGYHALKQTNGFLYLVGDSSVDYISGVSTSGSPAITTFTYQNVDPQIGSPWPNSCQVYSRSIAFGNGFGVQALYGGAVQKVSNPLDGFYSSVPSLGGFMPSGAVAILFGIHCYMLLLPIIDQITQLQRNALLLWDGKRWWTASQGVTLQQIASQEINSQMNAFGTDGASIYPLFTTPSTSLLKTAVSKWWGTPGYMGTLRAMRFYLLSQTFSSSPAAVNISIDTEKGSVSYPNANLSTVSWVNNLAQPVTWQNNALDPVEWLASGTQFIAIAVNASGTLLGCTISTTSEDLALVHATILAQTYAVKT